MVMSQGTGFITLRGKQFYDQLGIPFFPTIMNYGAKIVIDNSSLTPAPALTHFKLIRDRQYGTTDCLLEPVGRYDWANCETSIHDDFRKIKSMGINTVRFSGFTPNRKSTRIVPGGFVKEVDEFSTGGDGFHGVSMCNLPKYNFNLGPGNYNCTNCDAENLFSLCAHLLDIAEAESLKVFIICADHSLGHYGTHIPDGNGSHYYKSYPEMGSNDDDAADYSLYLTALANALKDKHALLAYDIYPEPNWAIAPGKDMQKNKETVCRYVNEWYVAIKSVDPNHLITLGGTDIGDVFSWDEGVMKVDFLSMHLYPFGRDDFNEPSGSAIAIEKVLNQISWCSNALQKPWIIGESGLSASHETCLTPFLWGTETDQYNYFSQVVPAVRDCGGSGFTFWDFQDAHYYCVPDAVCSPSDCDHCFDWDGYCGCDFSVDPCQMTTAAIKLARSYIWGNYFGILKYGNPDETTGDYPSSVDKLAVSFITAFDHGNGVPAPANCTIPTANYYSPDQFVNSATNPDKISGIIKVDPTNELISNAVVSGSTTVPGKSGHPFIYTFSHPDGSYELIPPPTGLLLPPFSTFESVTVSAVGAEKKTSAIADILLPLQNDYSLKKSILNYDVTVDGNGMTLPTGTQNFKGWNSLTVSNMTVPSGTVSDFTARSEINADAEFHSATGSEVHIYCSETFSDCSDFSGGYFRLTNSGSSGNNVSPPVKEIEVAFKQKMIDGSLSIIPNPSSGQFLVQLNSSDINSRISSVIIYDMMGKRVYSSYGNSKAVNVNLSVYPKGIYFLKANDIFKTYNQKIVLQ